jgi:hypothetical protein
MRASLHESDALDDPRDGQMALLLALVRELSDRVTVLEHRNGIESALQIDHPLKMTVKTAAHRSGLSESGIRKLVRENRVAHEWIGGSVFLTAVPTRRKRRQPG